MLKAGENMEHNICYAICDNKCKVEAMSKEQIYNQRLVKEYGTNADKNGILPLRYDQAYLAIKYLNVGLTKTKGVMLDGFYNDMAHVYFIFDKDMGIGSKLSEFITAESGTVKFLNSPDITNYTRVFLEVYYFDSTFYVQVSGC